MKKWVRKQKETQEEIDIMLAYVYDGMVIDTIQQLVNPFGEEGVTYHGSSDVFTEEEFQHVLYVLKHQEMNPEKLKRKAILFTLRMRLRMREN